MRIKKLGACHFARVKDIVAVYIYLVSYAYKYILGRQIKTRDSRGLLGMIGRVTSLGALMAIKYNELVWGLNFVSTSGF